MGGSAGHTGGPKDTKFSPLTGRLKCPYCSASLIRVVNEGKWVSWICAIYMQKGKSVCRGMRIPDKTLQELTKDIPITEAMVVEEMSNESPKKRSQKNFRLIPAVEYSRAGSSRGDKDLMKESGKHDDILMSDMIANASRSQQRFTVERSATFELPPNMSEEEKITKLGS